MSRYGARQSMKRILSRNFVVFPMLIAASGFSQSDEWSGNFVKDPGFEEDFVNGFGEGHVISFKGDWFYNQKDLAPDYWELKGAWTWNEQSPKEGKHSLKLAADGTATQVYPGAVYQEGGSAWGAAPSKPIAITKPDRFRQPWRATVWCRGGGKIALGGVEASAKGGTEWESVTVECPADKVDTNGAMTVTLTGPGEFDGLVVQEKLPPTPNLLANAGFEDADKSGHPEGWTEQRKFDWIGPTYYVWTDWMHYHEENRGPVTVDPLVFRSGKQSLRFDVYPGDEKFVESDLIALKQDQPHLIEVSAFVRADRIKLIDIRCVDDEGANLPCHYPIQPEYYTGGTALFGNGTFEWRYVRKYFQPPFGAATKGIRVRLAARGFNANTLDDAGTRSYAMTCGTVWWDGVRVIERTSSAEELKARGVKLPKDNARDSIEIADASLDLGERLFGENELSLSLKNPGKDASFSLKLTNTLPGGQPVATESAPVKIASGARGTVTVPYRIDRLVGDLNQQGSLRIEVFRDRKLVSNATYAFNTWPVVVDIDLTRHYSLPNENPNTASFNLGVAAATLAKVAKLEIDLKRVADGASLGKQTITDLKGAFAQTLAALPKKKEESYEFNMPTPAWWTDRNNLLIAKLDLSQLKVWPHDNPARDTVVEVRGLDAAGKVLFHQQSDGLCRVAPPPRQEPIQTVKVREDGAVLINDKPRYLTGATHQHMRTTHAPEIIAQLGLMGHRLVQGDAAKFDAIARMWSGLNLYALQIKPVSGDGGTATYTSLTDAQKTELQNFVNAGGMQSVVSVNTGGWESSIPDTPEARAGHEQVNAWVRQVTKRPLAWSSSGAFNAWNMSTFPYYDIVHAETEMWGPMDFNVIFTPYLKRARKEPSTWVYLPQLYDNTPYERYRFETYENIIRGSAGVSMIQGIGDPTFNRGLAGELRYLEAPLNSTEPAPAVTCEPPVSHITRKHKGKTYILATNSGPIIVGRWMWNRDTKHSGAASHEGDSVNRLWQRPAGVRIHGFRGLPFPELVQKGDKIVQYVWLDPKEKPDWVMVAVRGDGRYSHAGVLGKFNYAKFREDYGNILMYSELEHSVWHEIYCVMDPPTYDRAVRLMGKEWADNLKKTADAGRATVDKKVYQPEHFQALGGLPKPDQWVRIELDAEKAGLVGKLVDGFAYLTKNGRALWDYSALERDGKPVRVFCEDSVGIDRALLANVKISVPGLKKGTQVRALFANRTITADEGGFADNFEGVDTYGFEAGAVVGDMFGYVKDDNRNLPRMMPSGYGYSYGPTAVRIYEIEIP